MVNEHHDRTAEDIDTPDRGDEALRQRYTIAVQLYQHEDSLNWQKMGLLLVVLAALSGAYASLVQDKMAGRDRWGFVLALGVLGFMLMGPIALTLRSGLRYMLHRKARAAELEAMIHGARLPQLIADLPGWSLTSRVLVGVVYGSLLLWPAAIAAYFLIVHTS